jgi:hypothetical protein
MLMVLGSGRQDAQFIFIIHYPIWHLTESAVAASTDVSKTMISQEEAVGKRRYILQSTLGNGIAG